MPLQRRSSNRRAVKVKTRRRGFTDEAGALETLLRIEPFHRNEITLRQIDRLRDLIDHQGPKKVAATIGIDPLTLLRVTSGFGHKLRPDTAAKLREFLNA